MTKEDLQKRIEKKQKDIEKIEKRITKWTAKKDSEKEFEKEYGWLNTFESRKDEFKKDWIENCEREIRSANRDLAEANETLKKYQDQVNKIDEFNNSEKIEVIWNFLQEWRKEAYQFYVDNVKLYSELYNKEEEEYEKYKKSNEYQHMLQLVTRLGYTSTYRIHRKWEEKYFAPITSLTMDITTNRASGKFNEEKLNKILDKDVEYKYNDFVNRIKEKAGEIQDVSRLKIANNGIINGVVVGDKHTVKVETILAGGYNTNVIVNVKHGQILHYRVLVNIIS